MLWDYIVVGGGLTGSVVSNRLLEYQPSSRILIVEAGLNANDRQDIIWPNSTGGADLRWSVSTVPQPNLNNRSIAVALGTALGGGTTINAGNWVRGDRVDYDVWGEIVGDSRWGYDGQLPYMKKAEEFQHPYRNPNQHGYRGNIFIQTVTSTNRPFPLREPVLQSWNEIGIDTLPDLDGNAGYPLGVGDYSENKANGRRQIASVVYSLKGITVSTESLVEKVLISTSTNTKAYGIQLANGTQIYGRNTILSAGALRTPQVLMLSGIGPVEELEKHGIRVKVPSPDVGQNFMEHSSFTTSWRISNPENGWIPGSSNPLFDQEQYGWGNPQDFMVSSSVPKAGLMKAIEKDEGVKPNPKTHPLLKSERTFLEHVFQYFSFGGADDGSTVSFMSILFLPTARGSVKLASSNISDFPVIDPNYFGTEVDRYVHREAQRIQYTFAGSNATILGREILSGEISPEGQLPLSSDITDEVLNARLRAGIRSAFHPHGTTSMGKVVDTNLKVKGVENLYVVDTSVFPVPISAHLQVASYALAEQAAVILSEEKIGAS